MVEKDNIYSLVIDKVEQIFDGDYCVKAVNASGSVQTSANLTVQGEVVEFVKPLEDIETKEKTKVEMNVETSAEETNVSWFKVCKIDQFDLVSIVPVDILCLRGGI